MNTITLERPLAGALALAVSAALVAAPTAAQQQEEQESPQQREGMQETARQQQQGQGLMSAAQERSELSLFVAAVQRAGLENELEQNGPYTVFAPTDDALRSHLDEQQLQRLTGEGTSTRAGQQSDRGDQQRQADRGQRTDPQERSGQQQERDRGQQEGMGEQPTQQDRQELLRLVRSHVVPGEWTSQQLSEISGLQDVLGRRVAVSGGSAGQGQDRGAQRRTTGAEGQEDTPGQQQDRTEQQSQQQQERETMARGTGANIQFGEAGVTEADIRASNGVLHVVDGVVQTSGPAQQDRQQEDTERQRRPEQQQDSARSDTAGTGS